MTAHETLEAPSPRDESVAWIARNIPRGMYLSTLPFLLRLFRHDFPNPLTVIRGCVAQIDDARSTLPDARRAGDAAVATWEAGLTGDVALLTEAAERAERMFWAFFDAIPFIEDGYRAPGARVDAYGPVETVPLRATVSGVLADAGSAAPSMGVGWDEEVLVRASPEALRVLLARWIERSRHAHPERSLSLRADPDHVHLTLHAPGPRAAWEREWVIERAMLDALADAAGGLEGTGRFTPDALVALSFARA